MIESEKCDLMVDKKVKHSVTKEEEYFKSTHIAGK